MCVEQCEVPRSFGLPCNALARKKACWLECTLALGGISGLHAATPAGSDANEGDVRTCSIRLRCDRGRSSSYSGAPIDGCADEMVLETAVTQGRAIVTFNRRLSEGRQSALNPVLEAGEPYGIRK